MIKQARALVAAVVCGALISPVVAVTSGMSADAAASWYEGPCTQADSNGVTVVVDFHELNNDTIVRCSPVPGNDASVRRTGLQALVDAGINVGGTTRWGDNYPTSVPFVCRIEGRPAADEALSLARLSEPYFEPCTDTPPADAYWSYWHSDGASDWTYSQRGVMDRRVIPGGFEGWSFSLNGSIDDHVEPRVEPVNAHQRLRLQASAQQVDVGQSVTLTWESTGAQRLTASGDWDGARLPSGSEKIVLRAPGSHTFSLTTVGLDPEQTRSVTVEAEPIDEGAATPAPQSADRERARSSAAWLIGELSPRGQMPGPAGDTDWGLTIDALWALHAAGTGRTAARDIIGQVEANIGQYIGTDLFGDKRARVGGAVAKTLVAAVVGGQDPQDFGGYDLRQETLDLVQASGSERGRIQSRRTGNDQTNVFAQSLAVLGLARSGGVPASVVAYLARQQCSAGYFRMFLDAQTCDASGQPADTDGTAMAVQALLAARASGVTGLDRPITRAVDWLLSAQDAQGGFGGGAGTGTGGVNSNSTGLAAQALAAVEDATSGVSEQRRTRAKAARERAARWITRRHVSASTAKGSALLKDREDGAIAYTSAAFSQAKAAGIGPGRDQWRRSTAQALFALAPVPFTVLGEAELESDPTVQNRPSATPDADRGPVPAPVVPGSAPMTPVAKAPSTSAVKGGSADRKLAAYLVGQLTNRDHVEVADGDQKYVDYDATADVAIALASLGQSKRAARVARFLLHADSVAAYAHGQPYESSRAAYAEPLAKLALIARLAGDDRSARKLDEDLATLIDGQRVRDVGQFAGDATSTRRTAWVLLASTAANSPNAGALADAVLSAQCPDGSFASRLGSAGSKCVGEPVATSLATAALNVVRGPKAQVRAANATPEGWPTRRVDAIGRAALAATSATGSDGAATTDPREVSVLSALAATRSAAGLATWHSLDALAAAQRADGGFRSRSAGRTSDLSTSVGVALALPGKPWTSLPGLGLRTGVELPLAIGHDGVTQASANPWWQPWAWMVLAVLALVLAAASGWVLQKAKRS